jgi:hypothetical protein
LEALVDVRIGVIHTAREISLEMPDDLDRTKLHEEVEAALADDGRVLWLTDKRGHQLAVPAAKLAYLEIGSPDDDRRIGFGAE